jgi:hypothetical protein
MYLVLMMSPSNLCKKVKLLQRPEDLMKIPCACKIQHGIGAKVAAAGDD